MIHRGFVSWPFLVHLGLCAPLVALLPVLLVVFYLCVQMLDFYLMMFASLDWLSVLTSACFVSPSVGFHGFVFNKYSWTVSGPPLGPPPLFVFLAQTVTLFLLYAFSFLLPQWTVTQHITGPTGKLNHVFPYHISVTTNRTQQGVTREHGVRVQQWLTSRRLQYPNLLLPSSPVSMKENVSL